MSTLLWTGRCTIHPRGIHAFNTAKHKPHELSSRSQLCHTESRDLNSAWKPRQLFKTLRIIHDLWHCSNQFYMPYQTSAVAIQHRFWNSYLNSNMRMSELSMLVYNHEQEHICYLVYNKAFYTPHHYHLLCWAILMCHFLTQLISRHTASFKLSIAAICAFNGPFF